MLDFRKNGLSVSKNEFFRSIEDTAKEMAMKQLEQKLHELAATVIDPDTGIRPGVFLRRTGPTQMSISTSGSASHARLLENRLALSPGDISSRGFAGGGAKPVVYLAHASEDHETLAKPVAQYLQRDGIETWLDEWEIRTGDSLVQKMEEGLGNCTHFLVLLTPVALQKAWVRREIDVGLIRMVGGKSRFMGICCGVQVSDLSEFLKTLKCPQMNLRDPKALEMLVADIYGVSRKPPLGDAPNYIKALPSGTARWSKSASEIAKYFVINSVNGLEFDPHSTVELISGATGLPQNEIEYGILDLVDAGYLKRSPSISAPNDCWPTANLFLEFDRYFLGFDTKGDAIKIATWLVNSAIEGIGSKELFAEFSEWTIRRFNSAFYYLDKLNIVHSLNALGQHPFAFAALRVIDRTRRFVYENS